MNLDAIALGQFWSVRESEGDPEELRPKGLQWAM